MYAKPVFVLLDRRARLDVPVLLETIRKRHPAISIAALGGGALIRCEGELFALICMPVRLPFESGLVRLSQNNWPAVATVLRRHRTHIVLMRIGTAGHALQLARIASAIAGGLVASVRGCTAVVWDRVAHSAARWREASLDSFAPYPQFPSDLWVTLHPFSAAAGAGVLSSGLADFVGRELEAEASDDELPDLLDRLRGLAAWLIERGSLVDDGDTFASSATERLTVHLMASHRFPGLQVLFARASVR